MKTNKSEVELSKKLIEFMFGKQTNIFNKKGIVEHQLSNDRLQAWNKRFSSEDYNWKNHTGKSGKRNSKRL